jgi:hypothetical protein
LASRSASRRPSRKLLRSGHFKRFSKSKHFKNGGTKRVEEHRRKRKLGKSRRMVEKKTLRGRRRVDEDEVIRLKAPVKRLRTPSRAVQVEARP